MTDIITREMIRAACMANVHPDAEPSETEMAKMERSLRAALSRPIDTKAEAAAYGYFVKDFADGWIFFDNEADANRERSATGGMMLVGVHPASPSIVAPVAGERKFRLGDRVTKTKGSKWTGRVVGFYSTTLTPVGYAVESETETGSVQIYPEAALTPAEKAGVGDGDAEKLLKRMSLALDDLSPDDTIGFTNGIQWVDLATVEEIRKAAPKQAQGDGWGCSARKQSTPEPADCDWPVCGCDPYADKVIAALEDAGALSTTKPAQGDGLRDDLTGHADYLERGGMLMRHTMVDLCRRAASAMSHIVEGVGDGWRLVPKEPTQEMFLSAERAGVSFATQQKCWVAMLAAAPAVTPKEDGVEEDRAKLWRENRELRASLDVERAATDSMRRERDAALAAQGDDAQEGTR